MKQRALSNEHKTKSIKESKQINGMSYFANLKQNLTKAFRSSNKIQHDGINNNKSHQLIDQNDATEQTISTIALSENGESKLKNVISTWFYRKRILL